MNMDDKPIIRLAEEQDFQGVLKASEGVFDGKDYIPFVFHQWLKTPGKYMFVGDLHGKIIGFQAATIIDSGKTIFFHSIRIHQKYRGRGYSYHMVAETINQVHRVTPGASNVRLIVDQSNPPINALCRKLGYKALFHRRQFSFQTDKSTRRAGLTSNVNESKQLHAMSIKEAVELVLHEKKFNHVISNGLLVVACSMPCEIIPTNAELVFQESDKMFTDLSADQIRDGSTPRSLSHGRLHLTVSHKVWISTIYAKEREVFKSHLIRQVMASAEQGGEDGRQNIFEISYDEETDFDGREVSQEIFGSDQGFSIVRGVFHGNLVVYELSLVTNQ